MNPAAAGSPAATPFDPDWPLVLSGPILRRVSPDSVSVFIVLKHPRVVRLSVYDGPVSARDRLLVTHEQATTAFGRHLHATVATARPATPLEPQRVYGYDLTFLPSTADDEAGAGAADLASLGLLPVLTYPPTELPSFVLPPSRLDQVRILHGSCRKPHGPRRDALVAMDQILAETHAEPDRRPQQLFLTGDQIYGDDVDPAMLRLANLVGNTALGGERLELLPEMEPAGGSPSRRRLRADSERGTWRAGTTESFALAPTRRAPSARRAGLTSPNVGCHLLSLAEFFGMYLLTWSPAVWPTDIHGQPRPLSPEEVFDHPGWDAGPGAHAAKVMSGSAVLAQRWRLRSFLGTVPAVRRALANIATYMILDDHDVTDDWNLHQEWEDSVYHRPLGRRVVQNAMSAYAVFQGWGNEPGQFGPGTAGGSLLDLIANWRGGERSEAASIQARLGLPGSCGGEVVRWDYQVDTPAYQVIVLDTRTQRAGRRGGRRRRAAPALLGPEAMQRQITCRMRERQGDVPVTVVVSATPVFGHALIENRVQLKHLRALEWTRNGAARVDREAWSLHGEAFESLLAQLATMRNVVILSGDVHYGFANSVEYWDSRSGEERRARLVQCTSSPFKGEDARTRIIGGVPIPGRVPAMLGPGLRRVVDRVFSPRPIVRVGWAQPQTEVRRVRERGLFSIARTVTDALLKNGAPDRSPDWGYRITFIADRGSEPTLVGRTQPAIQQALALRGRFGFTTMRTLVGRNNLGDVEFLRPTDAAPNDIIVRQSMWFVKGTILSATGNDAPMPYTVLDVPFDSYLADHPWPEMGNSQ